MRFINKTNSAKTTRQLANKIPPTSAADATQKWRKFRDPGRKHVLTILKQEQGNLCCYSEIRPDDRDLGWHIEHLENKSQAPSRTFDYFNLLASALSSADLSKGEFKTSNNPATSFGGHAPGKQTGCNMAQLISPFHPDCHDFFVWTHTGEIIPSSKDPVRAQYTITLLNLNSHFLTSKRAQLWQKLDKEFEQAQHDHTAILRLKQQWLSYDKADLPEFIGLVEYFFQY